MDSRQKHITKYLDLQGFGIEIAPLFRPTVPKEGHNILYTDYTSSEVLREKNINNPNVHAGQFAGIQNIDFVWAPGSSLKDSSSSDVLFDYAVASHVIEHVPNIVGWLNEIMSVLKPGGKLALVIPNKSACFDYYRQTTPVGEFVDAWIRQSSMPSPKQIFDCLANAADDSGAAGTRSFDLHQPAAEAKHTYTLEQAFNYAMNSYCSGDYLDVHCSVFTPESLVEVMSDLVKLGLLNVSVTAPEQGEPSVEGGSVSSEFMVTLTKLGEPKLLDGALGSHRARASTAKLHDLEHARKAFIEAVAVQDELKQRIQQLESNMSFTVLLRRIFRKTLRVIRA